MKAVMMLGSLALVLLSMTGEVGASQVQMKGDKTITKVVKLLQNMLEKSKTEGDEERKIYAKFKCYCDQSTAEKNAAIAENAKLISILESKIEELQGSNGEKSSQCADLKASMAENEADRAAATSIRGKQNKKYKADKTDFEQAIGQMENAIATLTEVGADQTVSAGADTKQFMAGKSASLIAVQSSMKSALAAAEAFMDQKQLNSVTSFIQAPFTGTYTSQSGQVMGIIKNMRDTFKANLASAIADEESQLKAYDGLMQVKKDAHDDMSSLYDDAQETLGDNDKDLGTKRSQLSNAEKSNAEDTEFMEKLVPMCKDKAKSYDERKLLRAGEEVAVAEAISILNSDAAFETFSTVTASSSGAGPQFLQVVQKHFPGISDNDVREVMARLLKRAAGSRTAPRLAKVISTLQAENPFDTVLKEIDQMVELIDDESAADKEKLGWCKKERKDNKASLKEKKGELLKLDAKIDTLSGDINDPAKGLKAQIEQTQTALVENNNAQTTETADRKEANTAYQADVKNLVAADALIENAINVLKAYYDKIDTKFLQEDPKPPSTWENGEYSGQSEQGGSAIGMLEHILKETRAEEKAAHSEEEQDQAEYEDSMTLLKDLQAKKEKSLGELQEKLATSEQDLIDAQDDHKETTKDKDAVVAYLDKIRAGCDFITNNFDLRVANRKTEKTALNKAKGLLKASPAYKSAVIDATEESYGKCKAPCVGKGKDPAHVKCKACMADVTEPAYCAGHKGTTGC